MPLDKERGPSPCSAAKDSDHIFHDLRTLGKCGSLSLWHCACMGDIYKCTKGENENIAKWSMLRAKAIKTSICHKKPQSPVFTHTDLSFDSYTFVFTRYCLHVMLFWFYSFLFLFYNLTFLYWPTKNHFLETFRLSSFMLYIYLLVGFPESFSLTSVVSLYF